MNKTIVTAFVSFLFVFISMRYLLTRQKIMMIKNGKAPEEAFYQNVSNWQTCSGFSEHERAAIEYAERFCIDP